MTTGIQQSIAPLVAARLAEVTDLCRRYGVARLELFGSAATDTFDAGASNLDFLVTFRADARSRAFDNYFGLLEGLRALFVRDVDLLTVDQLRNPHFIEKIAATRRVVYAA
jgi:uncharacterized protein